MGGEESTLSRQKEKNQEKNKELTKDYEKSFNLFKENPLYLSKTCGLWQNNYWWKFPVSQTVSCSFFRKQKMSTETMFK